MAEHFQGRNHTVRMSNASVEELLGAWLTIGRRMPENTELAAVLSYLKKQITDHGPGWRAFKLDPPPEELRKPQRLKYLGDIIAAFSQELAKEQPDSELCKGLSWSRTLRLRWLGWMSDLSEMIAECIGDARKMYGKAVPLATQANELVPQADELEINLNRLEDRQYESRRRHASIKRQLAISDEILRTLLALPESKNRCAELAHEHQERAKLFEEISEFELAANEYRAALSLELDHETREAINDLIADLAKERLA